MKLHRIGLCILGLVLVAVKVVADDAPLADAVENQDIPTFEKLLKHSVDINAPQVDGMTALHWATYHDDLGSTRLLIKAKANVKAANRYGVTPLSIACTNGNAEIVELLLKVGADPNAKLRGGETVLMTASRTGKLGPVKSLISHGAKVNAAETGGQTAVMWAAAEGHVEVVEALLDSGADFRTPLKSGFTPFFFAVREGRTEVVRLLLKRGIDLKQVMKPQTFIFKGARAGTSALALAVENGHFDLALALLNAGADPNDQRSGYTPLHIITWVRKPNRGDGPDGDPPPIGSGNLSSLEFVRALIEFGADVNVRLKKGRSGRGRLNEKDATPFLLASKTADVALMKLLVELGADPLLTNADNCTPLMAAAGIGTMAPGEEAGTEEEAVEAVKLTLKLGGDINAVDKNAETAMHGAAYKNLPKVVELLAANGAKVDIWNRKNKYGWTPLLIAQGYRVGNFKPSAATTGALRKLLEH